MTVRELMEQMNADPGARSDSPSDSSPRADQPSTSSRQPRGDSSPTEAIPRVGGRSGLRRARRGNRAPADDASKRPSETPGAKSETPGAKSDAPGANEVTRKIPIVGAAPAPVVDLSDRATTERVVEESRAQESHREPDAPAPTDAPAESSAPEAGQKPASPPLEPTPDLTETIALRSRPQSVGRRRHNRSTRQNVAFTGRIMVAIACVMALVGTGFVWGYMKSKNSDWRTIAAVDPDDANIRNKDAQYGDENYLIVGTDTRSGKNGKVGAGTTADAEGARSDTVILVNIPANRSRVVAVSFPRDLQVNRPECQDWDNDAGTYNGELPAANDVKLNSVYADGGPKCLVKVITEMSGLNINHFIGMDFSGFEKIVRAVGGVEVCSTTPVYDYELGQILSKPGKQTITGRKALNYVRARTVSTEGNGDYGRIKRQQLFMSSLLRSTLSGNVLSNPAKLNSIVNTFIKNSYVDGVDTQSLLKLADSMQGIEAGRVTFLTIPTSGTATDGSNNEIPRTDDINAIFNAIIDDDPLPGEQAAKKKQSSSSKKQTTAAGATTSTSQTPSTVSATAQNPSNVGVRVLNGTGKAGQAADASDQLTAQGFDVRGVADASENRTDTVVRYGPGEQDSAATLAAMFPGAKIQSDKTVKSGVEVILGSDFAGSVTSAPAAGETLSAQALPPAANSSNLPNDLAVTNAGDTTCS
ncbi:putative LytR family transcriptional regulator [Gordonia sputi NBRC 100414]|uniref:Putative LytR family transcriptional regulator n=2 Tax=Gordoniaceae TaxID=85026 RepID=H5TYA7_9ACTN|nr:putative LytR family transcriptional regulator [Gordonia sputi NBRC 100414]